MKEAVTNATGIKIHSPVNSQSSVITKFEPTALSNEEPRQFRVVTIRMLQELHTRLIDAGHKAKRSTNTLCIEMIEYCLKDLEKQE